MIVAGLCFGLSGLVQANESEAPQVLLSASEVVATNRDTAINTKVMVNLKSKASLDLSDIQATTRQGVVTLTGSAQNDYARQIAQDSAKAIKGVKRVQNNLSVMAADPSQQDKNPDYTAGEVISDSWITSKIKSEMLLDHSTRSFGVRVSTRQGAVVVQGTVENQEQIQHGSYIE